MSQAPAPRQIPNTMYDRMAFPEYEFREWPQAIPVVDGVVQKSPYDARRKAHPVVMVHSQEELDALLSGSARVVPVNPDAVVSAGRVESEDDIRADLYVRADQVGAKIDKRWSIERIERAIAEASEVM